MLKRWFIVDVRSVRLEFIHWVHLTGTCWFQCHSVLVKQWTTLQEWQTLQSTDRIKSWTLCLLSNLFLNISTSAVAEWMKVSQKHQELFLCLTYSLTNYLIEMSLLHLYFFLRDHDIILLCTHLCLTLSKYCCTFVLKLFMLQFFTEIIFTNPW